MTIVVVGPTPPPITGIEVMTSVVLAELRKSEEFRIEHLDTSDHRPNGTRGGLDGMNVLLGLYHPAVLAWRILRSKPGLLYLPVSQGGPGFIRDALLIWVGALLRVPVVIHLHGGRFDSFYRQSNCFMRLLTRRTLAKVGWAIVLSPRFQGIFEPFIPKERVRVVPNGLPRPPADHVGLKPPAVHARHCRTRHCRVLYVSNLRREKGYPDLLRAVPMIPPRLHCRFVFAGEWDSRAGAEDAANTVRELGIERCVRFMGVADGAAKNRAFEEADIFVFPANSPEGQPLVVLEAMAHGLPVIATNVGAVGDCVKPGRTGILVEPGDTEGLAAGIARLAHDRELRERMGAEAARVFAESFTAEVFGRRMRAVLRLPSRLESGLERGVDGFRSDRSPRRAREADHAA